MKRSGFTLIEVVVVVGIIGAITGMAMPVYRDYQIRSDLNLATEQVMQGLGRARLLSQSAQDDSGWGFFVPAGILYKGDSYEDRDPTFDETYPMPSTITKSGLDEVAYSKVIGAPSATGGIVLTALNKDQRTVSIKVETQAVALVENDQLVICHYPPGNPAAKADLVINESAWPAHRDNHGDTLGPCPDDGEEDGGVTASSASSAASSANSSVAVSSAASSAGGAATCQDRFSVAADGTITTTGPLSVRFDSLGAQFGYAGGPTVPVTVKYRKKNSGGWTNLFSGNAINGMGGATQTVSGFKNNDKVILSFRAYHKQKGWLTYDRTLYSNDGSKSVLVLRNGDTAPTIDGSNGQQSISTLLQSITQNGLISIGQYDAVLLADYNRQECNYCSNNYCSNCTGVDYQDGVVLVKFLTPSC